MSRFRGLQADVAEVLASASLPDAPGTTSQPLALDLGPQAKGGYLVSLTTGQQVQQQRLVLE